MRRVVVWSLLALLLVPSVHAVIGMEPSRAGLPAEPPLTGAPAPAQAAAPASPLARPQAWLPVAPVPSGYAPGQQQMTFVCPGPNNGQAQRFDVSINVVYTCPRRVYDNTVGGNQGWLMGNMRLSINPQDPNQLAFFSLHGSGVRDGPADYARVGLTHSTFPSTDLGNSFGDEWTGDGNNGGQFGLEPAGTLDFGGHMYVGYLWATPVGEGYDHVIYVYKGDTVDQSSERLMDIYGANNAYQVAGREVGNTLSELHLVHYPPMEEPEPDNGTQGPGVVGEYTHNVTDGLVVMTFHEQALDPATGPAGNHAWIDIHWTNASRSNEPKDWQGLADRELIGPCRDASNPAVWKGRVYVACSVDRGYDERSRARVGDVDVWSFDPTTGQTRFESFTGINGDHPRLAVNAQGYMAVMTSRVKAEQQVEVKYSLGWYGQHWNVRGTELGPILHKAMGGQPILDAHATALVMAETENTAFAIYKEWNPSNPEPVPDPDDPTTVRLEGYRKFIFSFNECTPIIAGAEFNLGTSPDVYQREGFAQAQHAFNDVHDGLQALRLQDGGELVFFAVSDYGAAQFGAVDVLSAISTDPCPFVPPPPAPPPAPIPAAAALSSPYNTLVGASAGAASLAMLGYLLTVKRKNPFLSAVKSKK